MNPKAGNPRAAWTLLNFLLSPQAQELVTSRRVNCAVRADANRILVDKFAAMTMENFRASSNAMCAVSVFSEGVAWFINYRIRDLYVQVARGAINPSEAASLARKRFLEEPTVRVF